MQEFLEVFVDGRKPQRVSWPLDKIHALHSTLTETQNALSLRHSFKIPEDRPDTIFENHSLMVYLFPQPLFYKAQGLAL